DGVQWAGRSVTFETLRGKTVLVLVYASWCPKCNVWSGTFFSQLKEAVKDKPVIVLAINADTSPAGAQKYLTERGFFAENVLHGYDPTMPGRMGFESNLYNYVLIGPDGQPAGRGSAGGFFNTPEGQKFALPAKLAGSADLGQFEFLSAGMSDEVKALFWPWEFGEISEPTVRSAQRRLPPAQRDEVDAAIDRYVDGRIERIRGLYKGDVLERLEAHEIALSLTLMFRSSEGAQKAKQVMAYLEADKQFERELAAKKVYDGAIGRAEVDPRRAKAALRTIAQRFEGTHFGNLAEEALAANSP
ncbi:MAG TPA: redoxin family protein, partial [Thermoguttaceae bacterium]|nr:redoxin family protein [Thermoguttaceae bacterium]